MHVQIHALSKNLACSSADIYLQICSQEYLNARALTHTCCNKSEVLTVSEMWAEKQTEEKNLPLRRWQNEIDSQMRLKDIGGGLRCGECLFCLVLNSNSGLCRPSVVSPPSSLVKLDCLKEGGLMITTVLTDRKKNCAGTGCTLTHKYASILRIMEW